MLYEGLTQNDGEGATKGGDVNPRSIKIDIQCIYVRRVIDHSCVDKFRMSSNALHPKKGKDAIDGADANLKSTKKDKIP